MTAEAITAELEVAYLGPEGSFAHLVAKQRFPATTKLVPFRTVPEVFDYLEKNETGKAVVPIENSSGGQIMPTIDGIIEHACKLFVQEELSIDVKLALMAKKKGEIRKIYSHFAPLYHCEPYLKDHYPRALTEFCPSTPAAAEAAAAEEGAAAIGPIGTAAIYGLEVLDYPLRSGVPNVTQFFVLGHTKLPVPNEGKTSLVVALGDHPGSLHDFLGPFAQAGVNLSRIWSRPIVGHPNTYVFLIEVSAAENDANVKAAMEAAEKTAVKIVNVGSYPVLPRYQS